MFEKMEYFYDILNGLLSELSFDVHNQGEVKRTISKCYNSIENNVSCWCYCFKIENWMSN